MSNDIFLAGDEILLLGKVKKVAGNYLLITIAQPPSYHETELLIDKAHACRFFIPEDVLMVEYDRFNNKKPVVVDIEKIANIGLVRQLDNDGNISEYRWLQDLNKLNLE